MHAMFRKQLDINKGVFHPSSSQVKKDKSEENMLLGQKTNSLP